ncbi:site-specific integrase [Actinoallomurus sp. NBC_01490]|uniref:tyrosine-type recombinase/integrase n=1 Tax=Actinoallomurus sp. NBC_01490 TaxID=2903557 RepID=UPI002E36D6B9|nr:site-specific integrase [Actinoallomurus sp. NBC_01490]
MTKRRSRGDGGLHWDKHRERWIASVTIGYTPDGKRIVKRGSGKSKTDAKKKLKEVLRKLDDGLPIEPSGYTVKDAVDAWLRYGLRGRDDETVTNYRSLAEKHIIPDLGKRKLPKLDADDVDTWLERKSEILSTRTLRLLHSILNRTVKFAQARDKVNRNVVILCEIPQGRKGRPSKSLTFEQAEAVLRAAPKFRIGAYVTLSLLIGARTEELRALTWDHVDLEGKPAADGVPAVPPSIMVWHSVRAGGDTKTKKSRRTLALPRRCVDTLRQHRARQDMERKAAGDDWQETGLVFATRRGTELDAHNVRRDFRKVIRAAGLAPEDWTPREMRHSFVSLLSDNGVPLEDIARLVGHSGTSTTETVYRKQIRPVLIEGAGAMDLIFKDQAAPDEPSPDEPPR